MSQGKVKYVSQDHVLVAHTLAEKRDHLRQLTDSQTHSQDTIRKHGISIASYCTLSVIFISLMVHRKITGIQVSMAKVLKHTCPCVCCICLKYPTILEPDV